MKFLKIKGTFISNSILSFAFLLMFFNTQAQTVDLSSYSDPTRCEFNIVNSSYEYSDIAYYYNGTHNLIFMPLNKEYNGYSMRVYNLDTRAENNVAFKNATGTQSYNGFAYIDFEGITHLYDNYFAMIEEKENILYFLEYQVVSNTHNFFVLQEYPTGIKCTNNSNVEVVCDANGYKYDGLEGITYDPANNDLYLVSENSKKLFRIPVPTGNNFAGGITTGSSIPEITLSNNGLGDIAAIYHLGKVFPGSNEMLLLSEASKRVFKINTNGGFNSTSLSISSQAQPEGIAYINGDLFIASEADNTPNAKLTKYTDSNCFTNCPANNVTMVTALGCTDPSACNYDINATCNDGSCQGVKGCNIATACNYNPNATCNDGSCQGVQGCTNNQACNYESTATCDDGSCVLETACNEDCTIGDLTQWNDVSCECEVVEEVSVNLKIFLEGPLDLTTAMHNNLHNTFRKLLPGQTPTSPLVSPTPAGQPYHIAPWNYTGTEGAGFTDNDYTSSDVDWVLVSLRSNTSQNSVFLTAAGILQTDGTILFPDCFNLIGQSSFYIVIEHRNHLPVMSHIPVSITNNEINYDFTAQDSYKTSASYGQKARTLASGSTVWAAYSGNVNQYAAATNERDDINGNDKSNYSNAFGTFDVYIPEDLNLDGDVNVIDSGIFSGNNGITTRLFQ